VIDSEDQEQLQLLLPLEGLHADTLAAASEWLSRHGKCVTFLDVTYDPATAALFQQLPLSTAPWVGLVRLEVDGPDSLVALAPALPQLVALTHLRAAISVDAIDTSTEDVAPGVFSAGGEALEDPPWLQQLCPGLKSLHLDMACTIIIDRDSLEDGSYWGPSWVEAPVAELLPDNLELLHLTSSSAVDTKVGVFCPTLTPFTSLRRLTLNSMTVEEPDELLLMPALEEVQLLAGVGIWVQDGGLKFIESWLTQEGLCTALEHSTKLTGAYFVRGALLDEPLMSEPLLTALPGLRKLGVAWLGLGAAAGVQQLSALEGLQHLSLAAIRFPGFEAADDAEAVLSALSSLQQLTYLRLNGQTGVPRSTWEELLSNLPQLRVLGVSKEQLLQGGLVEEIIQLPQLQCLYVEDRGVSWDPAAMGAEVAPHLQVLSECSSLKAVLCWVEVDDVHSEAQPLWECVHQGRLHLSAWYKWRDAAVEGRVVWPRPCPHLPGVWELQQQEPGDGQ
jgi:hypothetical protein